MLDDKLRFDKVIEFLPEKFVDDFVCYYLYNASYPKEINVNLLKYAEYKKEILSEFSNLQINIAYINLNKSFDLLYKFLIDHFSYENPPFYYLEPRIHHNFGGRNKNPIMWDKYKSELDKIADEFEKAYKSFIRIAKSEIEQKEEILKFSPNFHGMSINIKSFYYRPTQYPLTISSDNQHIVDSWITNVYYDKKFMQDDKLQIGGWGDLYQSYLKFDLTGLPQNVSQAIFWIMPSAVPSPKISTPFAVCPVTSFWDNKMIWSTKPSAPSCYGWYAVPTSDKIGGVSISQIGIQDGKMEQWQIMGLN